LGWAHYQVRKDVAIRRHWQLVCCAFAFCWWESAGLLESSAPPGVLLDTEEIPHTSVAETERGEKKDRKPERGMPSSVLAGGSDSAVHEY
jgi:hypothetical protein